MIIIIINICSTNSVTYNVVAKMAVRVEAESPVHQEETDPLDHRGGELSLQLCTPISKPHKHFCVYECITPITEATSVEKITNLFIQWAHCRRGVTAALNRSIQ